MTYITLIEQIYGVEISRI